MTWWQRLLQYLAAPPDANTNNLQASISNLQAVTIQLQSLEPKKDD